MDFSNKTYRDHLILSLPEKCLVADCGGMCVLTFLDDLLYYGYNTGSNRGCGGPPPRKILLELVQNAAILDNS